MKMGSLWMKQEAAIVVVLCVDTQRVVKTAKSVKINITVFNVQQALCLTTLNALKQTFLKDAKRSLQTDRSAQFAKRDISSTQRRCFVKNAVLRVQHAQQMKFSVFLVQMTST